MATIPQTKPTDLGCESAKRLAATIRRQHPQICPRIEYAADMCVCRLPSGMTYEPPTAWNWSGPTDNACSYYPPQTDPFSFYSTPQPRLPFFPDMGISPYSAANELDYNAANARLNFLGSQSASHCGNGAMPVKDEAPLENSNDRFVLLPVNVGCMSVWIMYVCMYVVCCLYFCVICIP